MSAELLREAAALMRERAKAATPGLWEIRDGYDSTLVSSGSDWPDGSDDGLGQIYGRADAEHIASWHPAVALAVADWLDETADGIMHRPKTFTAAVAVARTYLGRTS